MCMISVVIQEGMDRSPFPWHAIGSVEMPPTRAEFDMLRLEVQALRGMLEAARKFDAATGKADCEHADKVELLRKVAKAVGVDLSDVLPKAVG
jgi:hypothetical protein